MTFPIKSLLLYTAVLLTGLSAGLFYAWSVSVIPGTQRVSDTVYLEAMQAINRAILNPTFFVVFFGPIVALGLSALYEYQNGLPFWLLLSAGSVYLLGTFLVTAFGNVPLNDQLDILELAELKPLKRAEFRQFYELKWNRYHLIRTICSILSFLLALGAVFTK